MTRRRECALLLPSGGYEQLKTFQLARLIYDMTVLFCDRYISEKSRTQDQMVQAARSGVQNIAEGSVDAGTTTKIELNLYNVARGSLVELQCDYQDFLRQRNLRMLDGAHPALKRFKSMRCASLAEVRHWVAAEHQRSVTLRDTPCFSYSELAANAALSLLNLTIWLLKRQIETKALRFLSEGGFSERLYRCRQQARVAAPDSEE